MGFAPSASRLGRSAYIVPHFFPQSNVRFWSRPVTRGVALRARVPPNNGLQSGAPRGARLKPDVRLAILLACSHYGGEPWRRRYSSF